MNLKSEKVYNDYIPSLFCLILCLSKQNSLTFHSPCKGYHGVTAKDIHLYFISLDTKKTGHIMY